MNDRCQVAYAHPCAIAEETTHRRFARSVESDDGAMRWVSIVTVNK